jgi:hypothetical protein
MDICARHSGSGLTQPSEALGGTKNDKIARERITRPAFLFKTATAMRDMGHR